MSRADQGASCDRTELVAAYVLGGLPPREAAALESHAAECKACGAELESLKPVAESLVAWPTDVLSPSASLRTQLADRIAAETGTDPVLPAVGGWQEPEWEEVAPGILCKILASDTERDLSAWLGNAMQENAAAELYRLEPAVKARHAAGDEFILEDWRKLTTSDHLYYMCTKYWSDGDVHKYFSPYDSPYDAYINFMNVLDNIRTRAGE